MKKHLLILAAALLSASTALALEARGLDTEEITKVSLIKPLVIGETRNAEALFEELSPAATQAGLDNARIIGKVDYKKINATKTQVSIRWHTISNEGGPTSKKGPLTPPLKSSFKVSDKRVEVGTKINAKGDMAKVGKSYASIGGGAAATNTLAKADEGSKTNVPQAATTSSTIGGSAGSGLAPDTSSIGGGNSGNLLSTSESPCPEKVDLASMMVFPMSQKITKDQNGNIVSQTACAVSGAAIPIIKEYGGQCNPVYDFNNKVGMESYRLVATINGTTTELQTCQADTAKTFPLTATEIGCSIRQDFTNNVAVQQTRLIYTDAKTGKEIEAQGCTDSTITYPHFLTATGCTPVIDPVQNVWVIQKKVAYTDASGQIQEAAPCAPTSTQVYEQYLQVLDHDFATQQSYMLTRRYWFDGQIKTWLDPVGGVRSTITFPHKYDSSTCGYTHDDVLKRSQPKAVTYVDTSGDPLSTMGRVDITACQDYGQPVNYAPQGKAWVAQTTTRTANAAGATFAYGDYKSRLSDAAYPSCGYPTDAQVVTAFNQWPSTATVNQNGWSKEIIASTCVNSTTRYICSNGMMSGKCTTCTRTCSADNVTYAIEASYLRPDATTYKEVDPTSYNYNVAGGATKPAIP